MARVIVGEVEEKATVRVTPVDTIKGDPGEDGVSPSVSITAITGGHRITITDANGTHTFDLMDGTDGKDGQDGEPGDDGVSPTITITAITGGHRVTITDADHPGGQTFDVMDGEGGSGGTTDYDDLTNKPQIGGVTLSGNKSLADLGIMPDDTTAADLGAYVIPSGGIPASDLSSAVQTSLGKADTALQSFTETDPTVPAWAKAANKPSYTASEVGALPSSTTIPSKTSDLTNDSGFLTQHQDISGKLNADQGVANAGKFLAVGNDGVVTPVALPLYNGGVS